MAGLRYVGADAQEGGDITNFLGVNTLIDSLAPSRASVTSQVQGLVDAVYATKVYIDQRDQSFVDTAYYQSRDGLNIPNSYAGVQGGVSTLDTSPTPKVPVGQTPTLGAGLIKGPWGPTSVTAASTIGATPTKIAEWQIGVQNLAFRPMVFLQAMCSSTWGQPIIEVRISDATSFPTPTYAQTTLVSSGLGRYLYNDLHAINVIPAANGTGQNPVAPFSTSYNIKLTAWLYDLNAASGSTVSLPAWALASGAAFLLRVAQ